MVKRVKAVCFGEVLYDIFPDKERIGGAPLNVASRLSSLGVETELLSKVGTDKKGEQIIKFLSDRGVGTLHIGKDPDYSTGVVNVSLSKSGSAIYEIAYPSAWDKIDVTKQNIKAVEEDDIFIFGSLICRDEISRKSPLKLLAHAKFKVLYFNLLMAPPRASALREVGTTPLQTFMFLMRLTGKSLRLSADTKFFMGMLSINRTWSPPI